MVILENLLGTTLAMSATYFVNIIKFSYTNINKRAKNFEIIIKTDGKKMSRGTFFTMLENLLQVYNWAIYECLASIQP